jgi:hypothetical protein
MIEERIVQYLAEALDVPVAAERPERPPARFCVVMRNGGSQSNRIDHALVTVQSYAESTLEAARLNRRVKTALLAMQPETVNLNSDYSYDDTQTKAHRYQAVFDIYYKEDEA